MSYLRFVTLLFSLAFALLLSAGTALAIEEQCICRYCQSMRAMADAGDSPKQKLQKYAPDRVVDVLHIKIDVTPDFENEQLAAETTLTFKPIAKPVELVELDAVDLRIAEVTATQPLADWVSTDKRLTLQFAEPIAVGEEVSVTVRYTAEPKMGLYFRTEKMGYPAGDDHLWTQGQTHEAGHWFPCFDSPNERSTTEVICRVPRGMTVLSNGERVDAAVDANTGLNAVHWKMNQPHASYLVCLVAGNFHESRQVMRNADHEVPLGFYSQPTLAEYADRAFGDTKPIMEFYEQEIGLPFPWPKYDQVTIRDFTSGGMENTTLTTLTHRTIYDPATETIYSSRNLDAHEMAHQWFGDYVTCEDWSQLWLNEGFATFYTHLYDEHKYGRDQLLYRLWRDAKRKVLNPGNTLPIVYRGYDDPWEQFDYRAYPKGAWVLHMLRSQLGKEVYRTAIKAYLAKHAYNSVTTPDLMAELEDVSGVSLDRFFDQWVYHGGVPKLKVRHQWLPKEKLMQVTVEQTQKVNDEVMLFHLPTLLRFVVDGEVIDQAIEITKRKQEFYVPLPAKAELVRFDPEYQILAVVDHKKPQSMLEKQLASQSDIIGRLLAAEALGKKDNQAAVNALQACLNNDTHYGVRRIAAVALRKMQTDEACKALAGSLDQADARARIVVVEQIGNYYRPEAHDFLIRVAGEEKNPAIVAMALRALSKHQTPEARQAISQAIGTFSFAETIAKAGFDAAADQQATELIAPIIAALSDPSRLFEDRAFGTGMEAIAKLASREEDKSLVRNFLIKQLNSPRQQVRKAAVEAFGELRDASTLSFLRTYATASDTRLTKVAKAAIKKIEGKSQFVPAEVESLRKTVRELQAQQKKLTETLETLQAKPAAVNAKSEK